MTDPEPSIILPQYFFDNVPLSWLSRLVPDAEKDDAWLLLTAAESLAGFVRDFEMAVRLFDMASVELQRIILDRERREASRNKMQMYGAWARIGARDGAIRIYHLGAVMKSIRGSLRVSPALLALVDISKTRIATKLLESYFPNYELIRNAIAHSLHEVAPTSELLRGHAADHDVEIPGLIKSKAKGLVITDSLADRNYVVTFEKKVASYEISDASHAKLQSVLEHFLAAFEPGREAFRRARRPVPPSAAGPPPLG